MIPLPVDDVLDQLRTAYEKHSAIVLEAPPGSGKTTRVAPFLIDSGLVPSDQSVFLLQPRRVAARSTAQRIAEERGWTLGGRVGYQVRFERRWGEGTRLVVATEGVLLRRMQDDPFLEGIHTVVLDEFHERSLDSELLLGMLKQLQSSFRNDLKIIVMSATLGSEDLVQYLGNAQRVSTEGRMYPVEIKYRPPKMREAITDHVIDTVRLTYSRTEGDILVFLPGQGEIFRVLNQLNGDGNLAGSSVMPLHGSMPLEEQSRVLRASPNRKIILATNVAETSLTIEGIRTVIDSGLARVMRFDPQVGLDRLELEPISQASATQRSGRAGRVAAGTCIRLWDESSHRSRAANLDPEIRRIDLSGAILMLHLWGEQDVRNFPWLQPPREESVQAAEKLLERLGARSQDHVTKLGKLVGRMPVSPRLARMLIEGHKLGHLESVAWVAAMLSDRDAFIRSNFQSRGPRTGMVTRQVARWTSDVVERYNALRDYVHHRKEETPFGVIHRNAVHGIGETAAQLIEQAVRELGESPIAQIEESEAIMRSLLTAFPDRLAKRRALNKPKALMVGGKGVQLAATSGVTEAEYFLCVDVDAGGVDATVRQASSVNLEWLDAELIEERDEVFFHPTQKQVVARHRRYWDDLLLEETPTSVVDDDQAAEVLANAAQQAWREVFPEAGSATASFLERVRFLAHWAPELNLPSFNNDDLGEILKQLCRGRRSLADLQRAPWLDWMRNALTSDQLRALDREAPERMQVPSGSQIRLEYDGTKAPVLAVRIQEIFSWKATPRIASGKVPVLMHLLAPNMRPQQVTNDLESFWNSTYSVVRGELKRRYPKHAWPEDPWTAKPERKG